MAAMCCAGVRGGRLHGGLCVAVAGEALHVDVVRREGVARLALHAGGVREPLGERGLLAQRLSQRGVGQRAAGVQPLPERVHHADLRTSTCFSAARAAAAGHGAAL